MIDNNPDKKAAPQADSANAATGQAAAAPIMPQQTSKGEKLFSWGVYSGVNYWVNLASSVAIADYFCNLGGKKIIERGAEAIAKSMSGGNAARHAKVFGQAQTALRTLTLLSGGWLLIIPMKLMEDNKRPIVHWLNEKMGVDQTAPDGHKLTPDEIYIECEQPKQSWLNVIMRRTLATAAVVGTGQALNELGRDRAKTAAHAQAHPDSKEDPFGGKSRVEKWVVDTVNKGLNNVGATSLTKDKNGFFQRYLALAALDTVFTKITAVIMHVTNGAKKGQMPQEIGDDAARSADPQSKNRLRYVAPEYEDQRQTQAAPENGHAARIMAEKQAAPAQKRNPLEKTPDFVSLAEKGTAAPSIAG